MAEKKDVTSVNDATVRHSEGTFEGTGRVSLYYQEWHPAARPARAILALVHGFGEHSGRYSRVVDRLVPRGFIVAAFDHRGHGRSPGQRGYIKSWDEFRGDVDAFLRFIREQHPALPLFLMGHSLGGLIVLEYALREPDSLRGVIASGPAVGPIGISSILQLLGRVLSRVWPRFSISTGSDASVLSRDPDIIQAWHDDPLVHTRATARLGTEIARAAAWTNDHAGSWHLPLLILHGGADRLVPPQGSRTFFERVPAPDKERHEYLGVRHEPHNDLDADEAIADVENWLERHL